MNIRHTETDTIYHQNISTEEQSLLPENPREIELEDAELEAVYGADGGLPGLDMLKGLPIPLGGL